jgi:hypothetical protein
MLPALNREVACFRAASSLSAMDIDVPNQAAAAAAPNPDDGEAKLDLASKSIRFMMHHPSWWSILGRAPPGERETVWKLSLEILEQYALLQQDAPGTTPFVHLHVLIHVLDTLRVDPDVEDEEKAWSLVERIYENNPAMLDVTKPIHAAMGGVFYKAFCARARILEEQGEAIIPPPFFNTFEGWVLKGRLGDLGPDHSLIPLPRGVFGETCGHVPAPDQDGDHLMKSESDTTLLSTTNSHPSSTGVRAVDSQGSHLQSRRPKRTAAGELKEDFRSQSKKSLSEMDIALLTKEVAAIGSGLISWEQWDEWLRDSGLQISPSSPESAGGNHGNSEPYNNRRHEPRNQDMPPNPSP